MCARLQEENRKREEDATQRERIAMQMIDWHEFAVVETINFDEGQDYMLPRSATHSELRQRYGTDDRSVFLFFWVGGEEKKGRRRRKITSLIYQKHISCDF